ncbi:MAG: GHKL domain-containing protein, partial [Ruminiclostridium sp.]|nr:GHKL domain-containing protein [Ruminiclostridium sp.]
SADGELPETTKPDRSEHGFGLVNIKNTAEKYGGGIDISCKGGEFTLTVMLMM